MRIEIRGNHVLLDGYVNVVGRFSRTIRSSHYGEFIEQIVPKTFEKSLRNGLNVDLFFNHEKKIGSFNDGNLELWEDNIGLRAIATVYDQEVIQKAKSGKLTGWSFKFQSIENRWETKNGIKRRFIDELHLIEVSILDALPAYPGTSVEVRSIPFNSLDIYEKEYEFLKMKGRQKLWN